MANTSFKGKQGSILMGGTAIANITSFNLTIDCEMLDSTILGSSDWKDFIAGAKGWTGTVEANFATTGKVNTADNVVTAIGGSYAFVFDFMAGGTTGPKLSGTALVQSIGQSSGKEIAKLNLSIQGVGAPTAA